MIGLGCFIILSRCVVFNLRLFCDTHLPPTDRGATKLRRHSHLGIAFIYSEARYTVRATFHYRM